MMRADLHTYHSNFWLLLSLLRISSQLLLCIALLFSLYLLFFPSRCFLVAFIVALALSVLTLKVIAKPHCVYYFASFVVSLVLFITIFPPHPLFSLDTSTYCIHTVVIVRQQQLSSVPLTLLLFINRSIILSRFWSLLFSLFPFFFFIILPYPPAISYL